MRPRLAAGTPPSHGRHARAGVPGRLGKRGGPGRPGLSGDEQRKEGENDDGEDHGRRLAWSWLTVAGPGSLVSLGPHPSMRNSRVKRIIHPAWRPRRPATRRPTWRRNSSGAEHLTRWDQKSAVECEGEARLQAMRRIGCRQRQKITCTTRLGVGEIIGGGQEADPV